MPNEIVNPVVSIELDRPRNLRITFNTLVEIEQETGKSIMDRNTWQNLGVKDLRTILWAALKHEDSTLTLDDVGSLLGPHNMEDIANAIGRAFEVSLARTPQSPLATPSTAEEVPSVPEKITPISQAKTTG